MQLPIERCSLGNSKSLHHHATIAAQSTPIPMYDASYLPDRINHGRNRMMNELVNFIVVPELLSQSEYCAGRLRAQSG